MNRRDFFRLAAPVALSSVVAVPAKWLVPIIRAVEKTRLRPDTVYHLHVKELSPEFYTGGHNVEATISLSETLEGSKWIGYFITDSGGDIIHYIQNDGLAR